MTDTHKFSVKNISGKKINVLEKPREAQEVFKVDGLIILSPEDRMINPVCFGECDTCDIIVRIKCGHRKKCIEATVKKLRRLWDDKSN